MRVPRGLRQTFCRHKYKLFANIYGDLVNQLNARTVMLCSKCGRRKFLKAFIDAPINYNNFLQDCALYQQTGVLQISQRTLKNSQQYDEIWGPQETDDIWRYDLEKMR